MAIQDEFGRIGFFEDFQRTIEDTDTTIVDADGLMWNDILIVAVSGDVTANSTVDEPNGILQISGAGGAADGVALISSPMRPDRNGTIVVGGRAKNSSVTDFRFFGGWASTVDRDETVNPFTLSGTTLTANNAGEAVGFYFDAAATTDDFRLMASSAGTAETSAQVTLVDPAIKSLNSNATTLGSLGIRAGATPTADKYFVWRVEMDPDGTVRGFIGDETMAKKNGLTHVATIKSGIMTTTSLYFPLFVMVATSTGDPTAEIDYFYAKGSRYWGA